MFRWIPEATREQKEQVKEELGRLPGLVPQVRAFHLGEAVGALSANAVHNLIQRADFAVLDTLAGPIRLCGDGRGGGCCTQQKQGKYGCKIPHGATSMLRRMNFA